MTAYDAFLCIWHKYAWAGKNIFNKHAMCCESACFLFWNFNRPESNRAKTLSEAKVIGIRRLYNIAIFKFFGFWNFCQKTDIEKI